MNNSKKIMFIAIAYIVIVFGTVVLLNSLDSNEPNYPKLIERNNNLIIEDTSRWHFPDSVTTVKYFADSITTDKPKSYLIWYNGNSIEIDHEIVINKPDGLKTK